jgi:hypothetical protein
VRRRQEIRDCVAETVIHEFGHYFGLSEEEIEEIEEKYWRGEFWRKSGVNPKTANCQPQTANSQRPTSKWNNSQPANC